LFDAIAQTPVPEGYSRDQIKATMMVAWYEYDWCVCNPRRTRASSPRAAVLIQQAFRLERLTVAWMAIERLSRSGQASSP
jgi:hypothetical protein